LACFETLGQLITLNTFHQHFKPSRVNDFTTPSFETFQFLYKVLMSDFSNLTTSLTQFILLEARGSYVCLGATFKFSIGWESKI